MVIRKPYIVTDLNGAILAIHFEHYSSGVWKESTVTFRDAVCSDFTYDVISGILDFHLSSGYSGNARIFYPVLEGNVNSHAEIIKIPASCFNQEPSSRTAISVVHDMFENQLMGVLIFKNAPSIIAECGGSRQQAGEHVLSWLNVLDKEISALSADISGLKVLLRPGDIEKFNNDDKLAAEYFNALRTWIVYNTEYVVGKEKNVPDITEKDLVLPYHNELKSKLVNGVLPRWELATRSSYSKIGPEVRLPIPRYDSIVKYYQTVDDGDTDTDLDMDSEQDTIESDVSDATNIFGVGTDAINTADSITLQILGGETQTVSDMISLVDFNIVAIPPQKCVSGSAVYRLEPLYPEIYSIVQAAPAYYDSFNYKLLSKSTNLNTNNIPEEYISGYMSANLLPLFPRELMWYNIMATVAIDTLMAEKRIFSYSEAERECVEGIRSTFFNNLMKDLVHRILAVSRGYTGRVPINAMDYDSPIKDIGEDSYISLRTCFYDIVDGKYVQTPVPPGYRHEDFGSNRVLEQSLSDFVNFYVKDTFAWIEVVLRLLREGLIKPTHLALDNARIQYQNTTKAIYFDINESVKADYAGSADTATYNDVQEVVFGLKLESPALLELCKVFRGGQESGFLDPDMRYEDNFIVGLGLWSGTVESDLVSKIDFLDIFTFVDYMRTGKKIGKVPISIMGIRYDSDSKRFIYVDDGLEEVENVLHTESKDGMEPGVLSLEAASKLHLYETVSFKQHNGSEVEYRDVIEPLGYIKLRSDVARSLQSPEIARSSNYDLFTQLLQFSMQPLRSNRVYPHYMQYTKTGNILVTLNKDVFMVAALDIDYQTRFVKLITYCLNKGVTPLSKFVEYLNSVAEFMDVETNAEERSNTGFESIVNMVKQWYYCSCLVNGKKTLVCLVSNVILNNEKCVVVYPMSKDYRGKVVEIYNKGVGQDPVNGSVSSIPEYSFAALMKILRSNIDSIGSLIFTPDGLETIKFLETCYKRYMVGEK